MKFYRSETIEQRAEQRLNEYAQLVSSPLSPPIPVDLIAERLFNLSILWDPIEELPGESIFGAIIPAQRLIILNESRRDHFDSKPGLERSTKGHELGHWDLYVDESTLDHPRLFHEDSPAVSYRSTPHGQAAVLKALQSTEEGRKFLSTLSDRADDAHEERNVNRYAAALSMPRDLITEAALQIDRTKWPNLYNLATQFDVTITALKVRLSQLNLLHVGDNGELFSSKDEAIGQMTIGF